MHRVPSSIAYQIEEVIPGSVAKQVRQVAALQGDVLQKTQAVMVLMTVLSLVAAAIAVANLMAASIGERGSELALLKAIGATDGAVSRLMLAETAVISLVGAIVGALLGSGCCADCGTCGIRFRHYDASDGVCAGVCAADAYRADRLVLVDPFDSGT